MMRPVSGRFVCTVLLLAGTLAAATTLSRVPRPRALAYSLDSIPAQINGWTVVDTARLDPSILKVLLPTSYLSRIYQKENRQIELFIAFYEQQRAGETMHSPKACLPGNGWTIARQDKTALPLTEREVVVNDFLAERAGGQMRMFYWYQSRKRIIASEYLGKLLLVRDSLIEHETSGSFVRILLPESPHAAAQGLAFAASIIPEVQRCFGQ